MGYIENEIEFWQRWFVVLDDKAQDAVKNTINTLYAIKYREME